MINNGFTIGEVLKANGTTVTYDGKTIVIKCTRKLFEIKQTQQTKCLDLLKSYFSKIEQEAREQIAKVINSGADPDYILKSSRELGDKEPVFEWNNHSLQFVAKKKDKKAA